MKLLVETFDEYQILYENEGEKKNLFIKGIFLQSEKKNRNGRIYPKPIMDKEVQRYIKEHIQARNSFGELNHPPSPTINLDRVSHIITKLEEDGIYYVGKAKILETPMGLIAKNIIEGGGRLGISSRGVGSVRRVGNDLIVGEDFRMSTAGDLVSTPSAQSSYVDAIMESPDWIYDEVKDEWKMTTVIKEIHSTKPSQIDEERAIKLLDRWLSCF